MAFTVFLFVVIGAVLSEFETIGDNFGTLAVAALTLNVAAMSVSFAIARVASLSDRETTAIAMELGIPAAVYSAFMFIAAGLFARLMFRHNGGLVARPAPAEGG